MTSSEIIRLALRALDNEDDRLVLADTIEDSDWWHPLMHLWWQKEEFAKNHYAADKLERSDVAMIIAVLTYPEDKEKAVKLFVFLRKEEID